MAGVGTWDESSFPARLGSSGERHLPVKLHLRLPSRVHPTAGGKRAKKKNYEEPKPAFGQLPTLVRVSSPGSPEALPIRQNRRYLCHAASRSGEGLGRGMGQGM